MSDIDSPSPSPEVPGQDPELWGQELFTTITKHADWCTIRQAQEYKNSGRKPDNLLEKIADGSIESIQYTKEEARQILLDIEIQRKSSRKEHG
jgi:hypothetical protein